mgnify:CR=1 FL=1
MRIYSTEDYSKFGLILGNRAVNEGQVKRLMSAMLKKNMLSSFPIVVNEKMRVVDGQHRLEAARRLKLPIFYVIEEHGNIEDVANINTSAKGWGSQNFVDMYSKMGKEDYDVLCQYCTRFNLPNSVGVKVLGGGDGSNSWRRFKRGDFVAKDVRFAYKIGDIITALRQHTLKGVGRSRDFVRAIIDMARNSQIDLNKLLTKIERRGIKIDKEASKINYLRFFEEVYNFRNKTPARFY